MLLEKVISGGQIGADIAGVRAAWKCGIATGGWMPKGFRTSNGRLPAAEVQVFKLVETSSPYYPPRTAMNVRESDGTITLAYNYSSAGEKLTKRLIAKYKKPSFGVYLEQVGDEWRVKPWGETTHKANNYLYEVVERSYARHVASWIKRNEIKVLNVAGNGNTAIEPIVERFLMLVFNYLKEEETAE